MLKNFHVKDYALIEQIDIEFNKGLNIITGETGAGKSILVDAMGLLLGERASSEIVRKNANKAIVEGIFDVSSNFKVKEFCESNQLDYFDDLILRREVSTKGTSRAFVNDSPAQLAVFKELGNLLVDLHGQHEHQSLLRDETHIDYLDEYAGARNLLQEYKTSFTNLSRLINELNSLLAQEKALKEKKDFYAFQIKEIDTVNPVAGEEEDIEAELNILENSEKLLSLTEETYALLYDDRPSIYDNMAKVISNISELCRIDKNAESILADANSVKEMLKEISAYIRSYNTRIDLDPEKLESLRERIGSLNMLKKKYGGSVNAVLSYREKIGNEFSAAENFSENISVLHTSIEKQKTACYEKAAQISSLRKKAAAKAEKDIVVILKSLGIEKAVFKINIADCITSAADHLTITKGNANVKLNSKGIDTVEFLISLNAGEDLKSLSKTASGGEISRIMLSLKTILATTDKLPLLIFDEIDTGVSGRIAQKIGTALKKLAERHQIISITHLPQIAGFADTHFMVQKNTIENRVFSQIKKLNDNEHVVEIAKLLSGEEVTDASLKSAMELIK
jgi:DNA repair protein RecN (Recombination protein N)